MILLVRWLLDVLHSEFANHLKDKIQSREIKNLTTKFILNKLYNNICCGI